jgi:hypothetical protein
MEPFLTVDNLYKVIVIVLAVTYTFVVTLKAMAHFK